MDEGQTQRGETAGAATRGAAAVLRERADLLRRVPENRDAQGNAAEIVVFTIGGASYGIETCYVREVCRCNDLVPLPCTPGFVLGVLNVHGEIVSVTDLRSHLGCAGDGPDFRPARVIVLSGNDMVMGLAVDTIAGVAPLRSESLMPYVACGGDSRCEYLRGVVGEGDILLLDAQKILTDTTLIVEDKE